MEGSLEAAFSQLASSIQVSWHFSIALDGTIFQHYDTDAQCWHARALGNPFYVGIEHEGVAGTLETDEQVAADIKLLKWLLLADSWLGFSRDVMPGPKSLWEHNELVATACPSGRIRWDDILKALNPSPQPSPVMVVGIGVRYLEGDETQEIWTPVDGKTLIGVGARMSDDTEIRWWP